MVSCSFLMAVDNNSIPHPPANSDSAWNRILAVSIKCKIPRYPVCGSVPDSILAFRYAGCLSEQPVARSIPDHLRTQSNGRNHRGIPMGTIRNNGNKCRNVGGFFLNHFLCSVERIILFQKDGEKFCGYSLTVCTKRLPYPDISRLRKSNG